jgi:hypothetical protein
MLRIIFVSSFLLFVLLGCKKENSVEPFNYERDTPGWLKAKIDTISNHREYYGTKVFRYEWNRKYVYHFQIPISSCAYCEIYNQDGNKITFSDDNVFQEFLKNKKNETLIWEWKTKLD